MSAWVCSVPGQTEGRRKAFLEWTSIDLSSKLSLTCGGNVNYYRSVHSYSYSACGNREHPGNLQNKSVRSPLNWVSRYILFLTKVRGRGRSFLEGARRGVCITANGNILASGNLCFRVFKLQLKVIRKNFCYLYSIWVNQIN